jgi:hypothetical protein
MSKANGLHRLYDQIDPSERFRLDVLAMARGDSLESSRLTRTCPRFTYTMNDRAFAGRWVCAMDMTLRIYVELAGYLDRLKTMDLVRVLMPYSEKALLQAAEHVYLEGHRAGARHAWREAGRSEAGRSDSSAGDAPEWPLEGLDEERIKALMDPAITVLPEILDKLERSQAGEALTLWRGFGAFSREQLGVDAEKMLRVVLEPAVGRVEELEALAERLEIEPDSERVRGIADSLAELWSIVDRAA